MSMAEPQTRDAIHRLLVALSAIEHCRHRPRALGGADSKKHCWVCVMEAKCNTVEWVQATVKPGACNELPLLNMLS